MRRAMVLTATMCLVAAGLWGCNQMIAGDWRSVEPTEVPPDVARLRQVHFTADGQFEARVLRNHHITPLKGMYQFTGQRLVLLPDGYVGAGQFDYTVEMAGRVMCLTQGTHTYRLCRDTAGAVNAQAVVPVLEAAETQPAVLRGEKVEQ